MNKLIFRIFTFLLLTNYSISHAQTTIDSSFNEIEVLNLGTFHFGITPDNHKIDYNEKRNLKKIKEITRQLANFDPTIILVEITPENQKTLNEEYQKYLKNPKIKTTFAGTEIQLLAFEIGRLSKTDKIIGIDHKLSYNYMLDKLAKRIKADKYFLARKRIIENHNKIDVNKIGLKKKLLLMNTEENYNFLININADYLTYVNSKNKFEGADEAAKFYQRNLRMLANINKVNITKDDRVLIIAGAAHAAFFSKFLDRSPIYELVDLTKFLK